ncbi:MAG: hypothetical protein WCQ52_07125 [Actinomycetes bacterium]
MITSNDLQALRHGLAIAESFGSPLEGVLDGVLVDSTGVLIRSTRFSGTTFEQPVLDCILLHQLSMALADSPEAALRGKVKAIDLRLRTLPRLIGFSALESLSITLDGSGPVTDLVDFGEFPKLRTLTIRTAGDEDALHSLQGLQAPLLEQVSLQKVGLWNIDALRIARHLVFADLSGNATLETVDGLQGSNTTLIQVRLIACASLKSLSGLIGATRLESLEIKDCASLRSLSPLDKCTNLQRITIAGCAKLESLMGLAAPYLLPLNSEDSQGFCITGCTNLSSLRGLPVLHESFKSLKIEEATKLTDISGIEAAKFQESIHIQDAPIQDLGPLASLENSTELHLSRLPILEDGTGLGCQSRMQEISIFDCPKLRILPTQWENPLVEFTLNECPAITSLGRLPLSLRKLSIYECLGVTHLKGVEAAKSLKILECDTSLIDGTAITGLSQLEVRCFIFHPQTKNENLARAFGSVMPLRLHVGEVDNPSIGWLTELPGLVEVKLSESCAKANGLSKTDYLKETEVRTLQRQLCRAQGKSVPDYLKSTRSSLRSVVGGAGIITMITSPDSNSVSQALELMRASGDAKLFDQVCEGFDPASAYIGDSRAIGRIFREVRANDRLLARWAMTCVLAEAPDSAAYAVGMRQRVSEIELRLNTLGGWTQQALTENDAGLRNLPMPSLSRFTALKSLNLMGLAIDDLSFLGEIPSLEILRLNNLPVLSSLKGLIGIPHLKSIDIKNCPNLLDIQDLKYLGDLEGSGFRALDLGDLGPLSDLNFVAGLKSLSKITFKAAPLATLSAFSKAESIAEVELNLENWDIDLSPLRHVRDLKCWSSKVQLENGGPTHQWKYKWPNLQKLAISFGVHNFEGLDVNSLTNFIFSGKAQSLKGLGAIRELNSNLLEVQSIDSLVDSQLNNLDVANFPGSFEAIKAIKTLRSIRLPRFLTPQRFKQLTACGNITHLNMSGFNGSLKFLSGWNALFELDLRNSGDLADIEVLLTLSKLQSLRLKGAKFKRDAWPKELQDRMSYRD